jgi:predicted adenylyl cyclase CyaB
LYSTLFEIRRTASGEQHGLARNIELKVKCTAADHQWIEERLSREDVTIEQLRQLDRYYRVASGRLKIRWLNDDRAELIRYLRPDRAGDRLSTYERMDFTREQAGVLDAIFIEQFGELVTVSKERRVGIVGQTRVHLDVVERLGAFVELETILGDQVDSEHVGRAAHQNVVKLLELDKLEPIAGSYSDLLLGRD